MDDYGYNWLRVTPDLKSLVYENTSKTDAVFTVKLIQTFLGPQPEPPDNQTPADIDEQTLITKELVVEAGKAFILTPHRLAGPGECLDRSAVL